jgi:hypothetical protein
MYRVCDGNTVIETWISASEAYAWLYKNPMFYAEVYVYASDQWIASFLVKR